MPSWPLKARTCRSWRRPSRVRLKWVWLAGLNIRCPLLLEKPARLASLFAVVAPKSGMSRMLRQKLCKLLRTSPENRGAPDPRQYVTRYFRKIRRAKDRPRTGPAHAQSALQTLRQTLLKLCEHFRVALLRRMDAEILAAEARDDVEMDVEDRLPGGAPLNWATCTPSGCTSSTRARVRRWTTAMTLARFCASISSRLRASACLGITRVCP